MTEPRPDDAELEALGLYDPTAPDASDRLEMIELSLDHGATIDEIRDAIAENRLHAVPAERVIAPGTERLTLDEVVARAGVDPGFARQVWRALGFVEPDPDARVCSEADVNLMTFYELASAAFGRDPALALARTAWGDDGAPRRRRDHERTLGARSSAAIRRRIQRRHRAHLRRRCRAGDPTRVPDARDSAPAPSARGRPSLLRMGRRPHDAAHIGCGRRVRRRRGLHVAHAAHLGRTSSSASWSDSRSERSPQPHDPVRVS